MIDSLRDWMSNPTVEKLLIVIGGVLVIYFLSMIVKRMVRGRIDDSDTRYRVRKFISLFSYILVLILLGAVFSEHLGGVLVGVGVLGAGIAFALQEVIVSFAGWLAVSLGGFYKIGDRVKLGGIKGDVIDIGILRTTIMEIEDWIQGDMYNGRVVRVANSFVFKEPVFNYSGDFPFLWDELVVAVKYGSDYTLAREILERAVTDVTAEYTPVAEKSWKFISRKYLVEDAKIEPMVIMTANDNWVEYIVRYVVDYKKRRSTKNDIFEKILAEFEQTEGAVQIASATFQVVGLPQIDVKLDKGDK